MIKLANDMLFDDDYLESLQKQLQKKEANNSKDLYKAFKVEAGVYDYDFDDGSIWKVETENGVQYLVKVVDDNNEDKVVRQASTLNKTTDYVTSDNFTDIYLTYYGANEKLMQDIEHNMDLKTALVKVLNKKVDAVIHNTLKDNNHKEDISTKQNISSLLKTASIKSVFDIKNIVDQYCINTL